MARYRCVRKCFHKGRTYNVGDQYTPPADEVKNSKEGKANGIPRHFIPDERFDDEALEKAHEEDIQMDRQRRENLKESVKGLDLEK